MRVGILGFQKKKKKLFSLIKNNRQDSGDISTLKDKENNTLHSDNVEKANLLNQQQFQSVFSRLSPLRLGQLSAQIIQKLFHENIPENLQSLCPPMPEIFIDPNEIIKLLSNLNPNKAAGPDSIKPIILKELRLEIAPVICLLFEKSLKTSQLPSEWTKAQVCPLYKKGDRPCQSQAHLIDMHIVQGDGACYCIQYLQTYNPT